MKSVVALLLLAVLATGEAIAFHKILDSEWFIFKVQDLCTNSVILLHLAS